MKMRGGDLAAPSVRSLAFGQTFQAKEVLQVLRSGQPGHFGQKDILAAGLSAWLLFPKKMGIRMAWMTHAMLDHMDDAELKVGFAEHPWSLPRDLLARYILTGSSFLGDVYGEFGGYQAFGRSTASDVLDEIIANDVKTIRTIVRVMAYLHYAADTYRKNPDTWRKPSMNRAIEVLRAVRQKEMERHKATSVNRKTPNYTYLSRSVLLDRWTSGRGTLALLYAANRLSVGKRSLLDVLVSGTFSYRHHGHLIHQWLQMAQYVSDHIFALLDDHAKKNRQRLTTFTRKLIGDVAALSFSPVFMRKEERRIIEASFFK